MGRSYLFECAKCGYKAKVSGRADNGFDFSVQTILCRDCKKLYDAVIRLKVPDEVGLKPFPGNPANRLRKTRPADPPPTFEAVLNRLPLPGAKRFKWLQFKLRCPISSVHKVQVWNEPGRCPRCGLYLEKNALPFRMWECGDGARKAEARGQKSEGRGQRSEG
jgi:hypothetical protein